MCEELYRGITVAEVEAAISLLKQRTEGIIVPVYKKGDNILVENYRYRAITALLAQTYMSLYCEFFMVPLIVTG